MSTIFILQLISQLILCDKLSLVDSTQMSMTGLKPITTCDRKLWNCFKNIVDSTLFIKYSIFTESGIARIDYCTMQYHILCGREVKKVKIWKGKS